VPHTLLLADDSVTIQRVIELTFAEEDVRVVAVSDGDQAIARIEAAPPDIVLADIGMPGKNGYEVAQYVKQSPRLAHIPVVLLTGAFEPIDQARASAVGCEGVLAKPFEPQMVIGRVKELLSRGRPHVDTTPAATPASPAVEMPAAQTNTTPASPDAPIPAPMIDRASDAQTPADAWLPPPVTAQLGNGSSKAADLDGYFDRLDQAFSALGSQAPATPALPPGPSAPARDDLDWFGTVNAVSTAPPESWDVAPHPVDGHADVSLSYGSPGPQIDRAEELVASDPTPKVSFAHESSEKSFTPTDADAHQSAPASDEGSSERELWAAPHAESTFAAAGTPPPPAWMTAALEPAAAPSSAVSEPTARAHAGAASSSAAAVLPSLADAFAALLDAEQQTGAPAAAPLWPGSASSAIGDDVVEQIAQKVLDRLSDRIVREKVGDIVSAIAERMVREEIDRIKGSIR
jgi:CheY-like chemotaxis protein